MKKDPNCAREKNAFFECQIPCSRPILGDCYCSGSSGWFSAEKILILPDRNTNRTSEKSIKKNLFEDCFNSQNSEFQLVRCKFNNTLIDGKRKMAECYFLKPDGSQQYIKKRAREILDYKFLNLTKEIDKTIISPTENYFINSTSNSGLHGDIKKNNFTFFIPIAFFMAFIIIFIGIFIYRRYKKNRINRNIQEL